MAKPIISKRVGAGTRIYYFDAYKDRYNHPYMVITEIPAGVRNGERKRQRIYIHSEDMHAFAEAFSEVVGALTDCSL